MAQAPQLPAYPNPLGILPAFYAHQSETLVLKEKVLSLSGDSFTVTTLDQRPIVQVKGNAMSLSGRKNFADPAGASLFDLRKELIALHTTFYAEAPDGARLFEVKSKFSFGGSKAICTFTDKASGKTVELVMKGNFFDTTANITDANGHAVAQINRKLFNARELLGNQQTYHVTVAPNVDLVLITAMCICLDEKRNEN